jgi:F-type H+-transporting ATPase subunit epsilon
VVRVRTTDGGLVTAAVHGGFLSVTGTGVSILAEDAELAGEIDVDAARTALQDADDADDAERARAAARVRAVEQSA